MSSMQTVDQQIALITTSNQIYQDNQPNWKYLLESYLGGADYRRAGHLTRYQLETDGEYAARLRSTPLENHCKSVISVYNSFLFREEPKREYGSIEYISELQDYLADADLDGRSLDNFMKDVATWASVFGHTWVLMTKPNIGAITRADEVQQNVRPYVNLLTPLAVLDWAWTRSTNGAYTLSYFKYVEDTNGEITTIKEWTPEDITTYVIDEKKQDIREEIVEINGLGKIPAIIAYNSRSIVRGLGVSDITDIADAQRFIYNNTSEVEQSIRLDSHPSLVKTPETQAGIGAGSLIHMPENLDPGLKPYILEFSGASVDAIYNSIQHTIEAIDKMANTGSVRMTESRTMSGVAMQTEFQLLNARLSEKADNLELCEEQMWSLWCDYMGYAWDGSVEYPGSFNLRDTETEIKQLQVARSTATDPVVLRKIDEHILDWMGEEYSALPFIDPNPITGRTYSDGEAIAESLPVAYQPATNAEVPEGENCGNCEYFKPGELYCVKFDAPVRAVYWCAKWEPADEQMVMTSAATQQQIQQLLMIGVSNSEIQQQLGVTVEQIAEAAANAARTN